MQMLFPQYFRALAFWSAMTAAMLVSTSALAFAPKKWIRYPSCRPVWELSIITIPGCKDIVPALIAGHSHESITQKAVRTFDERNFIPSHITRAC